MVGSDLHGSSHVRSVVGLLAAYLVFSAMTTVKSFALAAMGLCAPALAQTADPLAPVAWISGCWIAEGKEHGTGEMWLAPAGGTMLGVGRTVRKGKTVDFEFMQIRVNAEGKLVFVALPFNQSETIFVATTLAQGEVTFENANHDFPQRVTYRSTGPETLVARIEGVRNGATRSIDFPMRRGPCERSDDASHQPSHTESVDGQARPPRH